jgi:hypothetical protein
MFFRPVLHGYGQDTNSDQKMTMQMNDSGKGKAVEAHGKADRPGQRPDWADGLRKLYDSVVEEPLPDSFRDLLDKLDKHP